MDYQIAKCAAGYNLPDSGPCKHCGAGEKEICRKSSGEDGLSYAQLRAQADALAEENRIFRVGLDCVHDLIQQSHGVTGLHLNGDDADWASLRTGGRFEEWLLDFDTALAAYEEGEK